ncbi:zinc ribbon domain-containing protein [Halorussus sp. AFM4]|uniref:zinc ribbon domain-containing protein n=1 Tax=Halorussus sp. AFM4 TaxID=3421651 RepID=UPI003EB8AA4C
MGLFRDLGQKVEKFKQASEAVTSEEATHECRDCGERFFAAREACSECGSADVAPVSE